MIPIPREIIDNLASMKNHELRVTLALVSLTYGVGQLECRATYKDLMCVSGSSRAVVWKGIKAVTVRKLFREHEGSRWSITKLSTGSPQGDTVQNVNPIVQNVNQNSSECEPSATPDKLPTVQNVNPTVQNVNPTVQNVNPTVQNVNQNSSECEPFNPRILTNTTTTINYTNKDVVVSMRDFEENALALKNAGIVGPKQDTLKSLPHVTPDYIWAIAHDCHIRGKKDGLIVFRIEKGDRLPMLSNCKCDDDECRRRRQGAKRDALNNQIPSHLAGIIKR